MSSNRFGKSFVTMTFGESHGEYIGLIIDGCPSGISLTEEHIAQELRKRSTSASIISSPRAEADVPKIISGLYNGKTTGAPLTILIANQDVRPEDYKEIANLYRPGHADFSYAHKYKNLDTRGGGRASARETAARVAAGAVAKVFLAPYSIDLFTHVVQFGSIVATQFDRSAIDSNIFKCADTDAALDMEKLATELRAEGNSIGGVVELRATNIPIGLGEPVFDKLDARLAYAMMGIPAVKGVEIGAGFASAAMRGSENNDWMNESGFLSNNAGGILGGISNGNELRLRVAFKPIPTISVEQPTINKDGIAVHFKGSGRHDLCAAIRGAAVVEAMAWLTLADMVLLGRL